MFFPDTPRFEFGRGNEDETRVIMARFHGVSKYHKVINHQMFEMQQEVDRMKEEGPHEWNNIIKARTMFKRVSLGMAIMAFQQLTGANYFF
jgi:MFS transporter, SP family, sugar:H+ symporter